MKEKRRLLPDQLKQACDPAIFTFDDTSQVMPLDTVIGQKRAVQAIDFGLNMQCPGYNIFVTGLEGTGKTTIIKDIVSKHAASLAVPKDWCVVNNFKDVYRPEPIALPPGKAPVFSKQMAKMVNDLKKELPKAFESDSFNDRQKEIQKSFTEKTREMFEKLDVVAAEQQVKIVRTKAGIETVPLVDGEPISPEIFKNLSEEQRQQIESRIETIRAEVDATFREANKVNQNMSSAIDKWAEKVSLFVVKHRIDLLRDEYAQVPDVLTYLDEVQNHIVENVKSFLPSNSDPTGMERLLGKNQEPSFQQYDVNVLVDNRSTQGAPVIFEANPTYFNVFGRIEKRAYMGTLSTDFSLIQAGSMLEANGGYLIMEIESVLLNPFVWEALKRALRNKQLIIEDPASESSHGSSSLRPGPIPLAVKVILLGSYDLFQMLQNYDSKFNKIFKVRADFDHEVTRTDQTELDYAHFIARVCKENGLHPFSARAVAAMVEFGIRQAADKSKLSIRFGLIEGMLKEADYWARRDNANRVERAHVVKALKEHRFRYNLYEEKVHESYADNTIMIDVEGSVVGQANALAVYQVGEIAFGRPSRITAEAYLGKEGVINIERRAKLSGRTHDKGVLILAGYLGRTFAQKHPLSLSISITFEQSYGGIDGDSASSTELYTILSSLAGMPIEQGIAVTGSVNQKGQIQAIGGVNEKIEGFFEVCREKGLTGKQGVIIPRANVKNLMLRPPVIRAVSEGKFHIFQVSRVEQGIEILTGAAAGSPDEQGVYPAGTLYGAVQEKLHQFWRRAAEFKKEFEGLETD